MFFGLFEKKIFIELPDKNGGTRKIRISKKKFDEISKDGVRLIKTHILCPWDGYYTDWWEIEDIGITTYEKLQTNGDIYSIINYKDGTPTAYVVAKELWDDLSKEYKPIDEKMDLDKLYRDITGLSPKDLED